MARSASISSGSKRVRKNASQKQNLLPDTVQYFIARRVTDGFGLLQIIIGLFISLSIIDYAPGDLSLNAVNSEQEITNITGHNGAVVSDLFVQSFGLTAFLIGACFIIWGLRVILRKPITRLAFRLTGLILSVIFLSSALAALPSPNLWQSTPHFAGSVGVLIFNALTGVLVPIIGIAAHYALLFVMCILGLVFGFTALGLGFAEWPKVRALIGRSAYFVFDSLRSRFYKFMKWHHHFENLERRKPEISGAEGKPRTAPKVTVNDDEAPKKPLKMQIVQPKETTKGTRDKVEKQPSLKLSADTDWELPPLDLLQETPAEQKNKIDERALQQNAELLSGVLTDFNVEGEIIKVNPGPIVTLYELEPAPGTKSSRVINLADDIARSMSATSVRVAVIPGKNALGIEMPNIKRETVYMRELLASRTFELSKAKLPLVLGKDIGGEPIIADLARMPHLLVAGTTGSGKSVSINTMLLSLLYRHSPETCRLILIDPKMLELSVYDDIPHLMTPVVTEPHKAITSLKWAVHEMEDRYRAMSKLGVRNIEGYNKRIREAQKTGEIIMHKVQTGFDLETGKPVFEEQPINLVELPYIVIVVDEFADLMLAAGKEVENAIQRLAQMARAAGLHLIMATQRPSVDVITGVIKANFPTRISFSVTSKIDSRTILGEGGAEQLLGMGDMLYMAAGGKTKRVHGPFVDDDEVEHVVNFLKEQGEPEYIDAVTDGEDGDGGGFGGIASGDRDGYDELYDQAVQIVITERKASTSFIQRHLQIGYNRAARIIETMEKDGLIGPANHVGKREILLDQRE
jgi:S-DNA-T family DNA segregation ATPase FtsK/SpoIIIE